MSAAASPSRSRRGPRQYLPLVLGLALLAVTLGAEHGDLPSDATVRPAVVGQATGAVPTDGWAGQERVAATAPGLLRPGWQLADATDGPAPAADRNRGPAGVPAFRPAPPAPAGQPAAPGTVRPLRGGVAPAPSGPRAPPLPIG